MRGTQLGTQLLGHSTCKGPHMDGNPHTNPRIPCGRSSETNKAPEPRGKSVMSICLLLGPQTTDHNGRAATYEAAGSARRCRAGAHARGRPLRMHSLTGSWADPACGYKFPYRNCSPAKRKDWPGASCIGLRIGIQGLDSWILQAMRRFRFLGAAVSR